MLSPGDVCGIVDGQPGVILLVAHIKGCLEAVGLCISDVCAVEEGAEEKEG